MNPSTVRVVPWSDLGRLAGITWMRRDLPVRCPPDFILCCVALGNSEETAHPLRRFLQTDRAEVARFSTS